MIKSTQPGRNDSPLRMGCKSLARGRVELMGILEIQSFAVSWAGG